MSLSKLPSGRWRAQVWDPAVGRNVSVGAFDTKREAKAAREAARARLGHRRAQAVTVKGFWERWTTDPVFERPKRSSDIRRRELTKAFAEKFGQLRMDQVDDSIVALWLAGGKRNSTVMGLRSMFNDARSPQGGRLVDRNPFERLGISRGPGRRHQKPPAEELVWTLIRHARDLVCPSFAAWLQVAAFTGMRPGELDALRWSRIDFDAPSIHVVEQFSAATRTFELPKNGEAREAILTPTAREALLGLSRDTEFCFVSLRGTHWTASSRAYHWKAVRAAAGYTGSLYLATRHFAGWYMVNILELPSEDVAIALGHTDGGELVRKLYGHRDETLARARVLRAYEQAGRVTPLRPIQRKDGA